MSKSRTQNSILNASVEMLLHMCTLLLSFANRTVFINLLSSEHLGLNGLFSNVLTILSLAELGLGDAMVFAMYKPMKEGDYPRLNALLQLYRKAFRVIACVVVCIGIVLSFYLDLLVKDLPNIEENLQIIFLIYIANNACSYIGAYKKSLLIVGQKKYLSSICSFFSNTIQTLGQIFILWKTGNYYVYLLVQLFCTILNNCLAAWVAEKIYPYYGVTPRKLCRDEITTIVKSVKALSISKIAGVISNGSDNIVIAKIIGVHAVGIASNYTMIINAVNGLIWAALNGIYGSIGNLNVDSSLEHRQKVFDELFLLTYWVYAVCCISLMTLLEPFMSLWIGENYLLNHDVVFSLIQIIYVGGVNYPLFAFRTTMGYFEQAKWFFVASAILNVILSISLGLRWGLVGVYVATSLSRLFTSEISDGYITYKYCLMRPARNYFIGYIGFYAIYILTMLCTYFVVKMIMFAGIFGLLTKAITCLIVSNSILFLVFRKNESFIALRKRIRVTISR